MMKHLIFIVMCLPAFLAFSPTAIAQKKLSISLAEAVAYALSHNLNMENADLAVLEANKRIWETKAQGLPQVDAAIDYTNYLGAEMSFSFGEGPPITRKFEPTSNAQLTVGQLLFSGNYIVGVQIAKLYKDLTTTQYKKSELDIRESVAKAYYLVLMAERSKEIAGKNLQNLKDILKKTEALARVGIADRYDVDQLSVQAAMVEQSLKSAERQSAIARNLLRLHLGAEVDTELELTDTLDEILSRKTGILRQENSGLAGNLDLQLMKSQELIAEKQTDLEKMSFMPTVSTFFSHSSKLLKPEFDLSPKNVVGIKATIPLFSSGMRKSRVDQAKIRLEIQQNNMRLMEDQLAIQEKQLIFNVANAREQYEIQKRNIEVAKNVYENYNRKYEQGVASSLDLTTANNNYLQAESGYINAVLQLLEAETALSKLYSTL